MCPEWHQLGVNAVTEAGKGLNMMGKGYYLREGGGQYAGPFEHHEDAERFMEMMESFGESCDDVDIVEIEDDADGTTASQVWYIGICFGGGATR